MKPYFFKVLLTALVVIVLNFLILLFVRAPIAAEYWIREFSIVKRYQAATMPSPKILFAGGSATLFGVNAREVEQALDRPAFNDGLMAGLRLQDLLDQARADLKPGDTLVLSLEPAYYDYWGADWSEWQLRNALAWNRPSFDRLPLEQRLQICFGASDPSLSFELCQAWLLQTADPGRLGRRFEALDPEPIVLARYFLQKNSATTFEFSTANLDDRGDLMHADANIVPFGIPVARTRPASIPAEIKRVLAPFVAEMQARKVRVYFDYTPYVVEGTAPDDWQGTEAQFDRDVRSIGGEMLEQRNQFFYPRSYFFDNQLHLNTRGREVRTYALIKALRLKLGRTD